MRRKLALALIPISITFAFFPMLQLVYYAALDGHLERANTWMALCVLFLPNLIAWLLGAFIGQKMKPVFHVIPLILISVAEGLFLWKHLEMFWFGAFLWMDAMIVSSVLTSYRSYTGVFDVSISHTAFFGLVFFGVEAFVGAILGEGYHRLYAQTATAAIRPLGVFWMLAVIWIAAYFHARSLNESRGRKTPRRVMIFNIVTAAVFTLAVLVIYHIDAVRDAVATVLVGILYLFGLLSELMAMLLGSQEPTGENTGEGGMDIAAALDADPHKENLFDIIFMRFMLVVVIILLVIAAVFLTWQLIKFIRHLIRKMNGFLNSWEATNQSYTDEQEDLMNAAIFRQEMAERAERIRQRFRRRPRLEELPDDRTRIRTLYRWMLERSARKGEYNAAQTSEEFLSRQYADGMGAAFARAYDKARYSGHEPDPGEVREGENLYRRK